MTREDAKTVLGHWVAVIGITSGLLGLVGAWLIIPYRIAATESSIIVLRDEIAKRDVFLREDHDRLIRIEAKMERLERSVGGGKGKVMP